jgi:hypothetical protein
MTSGSPTVIVNAMTRAAAYGNNAIVITHAAAKRNGGDSSGRLGVSESIAKFDPMLRPRLRTPEALRQSV